MKVTINEITYEGTEDEIRRIVENPPRRKITINGQDDFPDNGGREPNWPFGTYPWPDSVPSNPCEYQKNWDGSPRVTCGLHAEDSVVDYMFAACSM